MDLFSATPPRDSQAARAARIRRPTVPNEAPEELLALPSQSTAATPPGRQLVPAVTRASLADRDVAAEPEPIVAPEQASARPLAAPALELEPSYLTERNAAAPTVKVTIGRIEVRAAPQAAPAPAREPPRPRQPALSLEDYLKRRNGGSR